MYEKWEGRNGGRDDVGWEKGGVKCGVWRLFEKMDRRNGQERKE